MARSPFQGTFQPNLRPTVVTAPDALVYINGDADIVACPNCKKKFPFSKYITSIQVDLNVDSPPGSANISMAIPRHAIDDFLFDGVPLVTPMMEIEIFAKGNYLLEGIPQYYPIFWGLVTEVTDGFSNGEHTVNIVCADILKWWELCKMNINAAFTGPSGQEGRSLFGNVFFGMNPYDVIFTLAQQSFGDVVIGTGSLTSVYKEAQQKQTFNVALADIMAYWNERFGRIRSNLTLFGVNGVAVRGDALQQKFLTDKVTSGTPIASTAVRNANGNEKNAQTVFDPTSQDVVAFRTQVLNAGTVNFWQSEYQTKMELANAAKEAIGFEFYMDVTGDIVFKPPFYNLDTISNKPVSWIQDIDIIDWNFSDSESEVVTQLTMQGNFTANADYGLNTEELTPYTSVTDYHLLRKYGWRSHTYNSEFLGDTQLMFYHGMDVLDRINSTRHRGSITMPIRPELRLGFPVYVAPKDQMWYVSGISHNIQFGGRATTTLSLTARREKFKAPKGIGTLKMTGDVTPPTSAKASQTVAQQTASTKDAKSDAGKTKDKPTSKELARKKFTLEVGKAATLPAFSFDPQTPEAAEAYSQLVLRHPKTGRICGYPNVVMVYTRPFSNITLEEAKRAAGRSATNMANNVAKDVRDATNKAADQNAQELVATLTDENIEKLTKAHNANRWRYGLNSAGVFVYAHETEQVVTQVALLPSANITVKSEGKDVNNILSTGGSSMIRPVSDERGFEHIGFFRYGRGISLRDGRLTLTNPGAGGGRNDVTGIGVQVALSGDLFASLHAQSQGLTTISTSYANPADALARMVPDDLQTAATITPGMDSDTAKFVNTEKTFVDSAPLGSPEQQGLPTSIEAGQLSRALTLAEMSVQEDQTVPESDCLCSMKADLAFINLGYTVKTLNPSSAETTLFQTEEQAQAEALTLKPQAPKFENVREKVEKYLFDLYKAFDEPHQEYEKALRGEFLPQSSDGFDQESRPQPQTFGDLSPPFSPGNRATLGDPVAIALQGSSAEGDLKRSWKQFGEDLKSQGVKAAKTQEVFALKSEKAVLSKTLKDLQDVPGSEAQQAALKKQIADIQSRITQLEGEIGIG